MLAFSNQNEEVAILGCHKEAPDRKNRENRGNFGKIVRMADLANNPDRYVVLQEILHGGPEDDQTSQVQMSQRVNGLRISLELVARFARQVDRVELPGHQADLPQRCAASGLDFLHQPAGQQSLQMEPV